MLMVWGVIWGAVFGGALGHNGFFGTIVGGFFGFFAGLSLQLIISAKLKGAVTEAQRALAAAWETEEKRKQRAASVEQRSPSMPIPQAASAAAANVDATKTAAKSNVAEPMSASGQAPIVAPADYAEPVEERDLAIVIREAMVGEANILTPRPLPSPSPTPSSEPYVQPEPSAIELGFIAAKNWLFGGNTVVRIGIVVLFLGLLFLAKYAVDNEMIPVEVRLAGIGLAGVALLVLGWRSRAAKPAYALNLQGAGVAVLYLTTFAALKLYHMIDPGFAFAVMAAVCALSTALALLQNSRAMAMIGFTGGFLVPVLLSTGGGSHIALFSYYAILNMAVLAIAWFKPWRLLSVISFFLTFGIAGIWAHERYAPIHYASCQTFLLAAWAIYLLIALIYANRPAANEQQRGTGFVDGTLVFGMALVGFGMQAAMVRVTPYASAFSAVMAGAVYLGLALWQIKRANQLAEAGAPTLRLAGESLLAIGVGFATLAIPLAFGAEVTAAAWAIEGAAIVWVGLRQKRWLARAFGFALQPAAMVTFFLGINNHAWENATPVTQFFLNTEYIGMLLLAAGAGVIAWVLRNDLKSDANSDAASKSFLQRGYESIERKLAAPACWYAFFLWCIALSTELTRSIPSSAGDGIYHNLLASEHRSLSVLMFILLSAAASFMVGRSLAWKAARGVAYFALPLLVIYALASIFNIHAGFNGIGYVVWPLALLIHYWLMRQNDPAAPSKWYAMAHAVSVWMMVVLAGGTLARWVSDAELWRTAWASVTLVVAAVVALVLLIVWVKRATQTNNEATSWPLQPYLRSYIYVAALPLLIGTFFGGLGLALVSDGNAAPLPYIPFINPVEISVALVMAVGVAWVLLMRRLGITGGSENTIVLKQILIPYGALAFVLINTVWLRIAHHFFAVPWNEHALFSSFFVQTGYAILWSVMALVLMVAGHRKAQRGRWIFGASLLGLTVFKLVVIDMSNTGGVARVVAFIAVGVLMLIVGYFAPLPPAEQKINAEASENKS